jgi:uncharacterized membrane protein YccC
MRPSRAVLPSHIFCPNGATLTLLLASLGEPCTLLVFVVEYLVTGNYGLAVIFITPVTVCFAEFTSGGVPIHGQFATRLIDIILGSLIGAAGGTILHHPEWCRKREGLLHRLLPEF